MPRTHARHPAGQNFAALLHELRQDVCALVVDKVHLLDTELANFLFPKILALAARPPSWTSWSARTSASRTGFAAWSAVPASALPTRSSARRCCLLLILCHIFHPFAWYPRPCRYKFPCCLQLVRSRRLFRRSCRSGRGRAPRAPCRALVAFLGKFLLALQILV